MVHSPSVADHMIICAYTLANKLTELSTHQRLGVLSPLSLQLLCEMLHSWTQETFPLQLQSSVDVTVHRHATMQVTSTCRCCSQVDKREWRFIHLLIRALHPLVNCSGWCLFLQKVRLCPWICFDWETSSSSTDILLLTLASCPPISKSPP